MTAPNLLTSTSVTGKTALSLLTTTTSSVLINAASSNTVAKIENITLTNYTGTSTNANISVVRSATPYFLGGNVAIPANSSLILLAKDTTFYLEEGDTLQGNVNANSSVNISVAYELISQ